MLNRQRWERCKRELEMFKQRLKQREQDHLDQIMILKKSLEKKVSSKYSVVIKILIIIPEFTFILYLKNSAATHMKSLRSNGKL